MSDWIKHDGKSLPEIGAQTEVLVRFADGGESTHPWSVEEWGINWVHSRDKNDADIVAYKVVKRA